MVVIGRHIVDYIKDPLPPLTIWEAQQEGALEEREMILNERMIQIAYERKQRDLDARLDAFWGHRRKHQVQ